MKQAFDPMVYDALLELTTRIGGQYVEWERQATALEEQEHWKQAGIALRAQVRAIDPDDVAAIEAKRLELRELFQSLPETAPTVATAFASGGTSSRGSTGSSPSAYAVPSYTNPQQAKQETQQSTRHTQPSSLQGRLR